MSIKTRRRKRGGTNKTQKNELAVADVNRPSLFSTIGTAASKALKNTVNYVEDKGARFFGFERVKDEEQQEQQPPSEMYQKASQLKSTASNIASGVLNKANQVGAIIVDELNKKIESSDVKGTISQAIGNTVEIAKDIAEEANEKLNDPELVQEMAELTKRASETAATLVEAADPAINKVIDQTSEIGEKMLSKVGDSAVNIALNTAEAVPGAGAAIGLLRDVDKMATAAEAVVEAGANTVTTIADGIAETEKALKEKMQEVQTIADRTQEGVNKFNNADVIPKPTIPNATIPNATTSVTPVAKVKKGGASRKFKRIRKKLSRKLRFR
jgi:hypothetical protein